MALELALGVAVAVGAFVQGSIGFGSAVVAAPFVVAWAPETMPVALLLTGLVLPTAQLVHGPRHVAWRPLTWALTGRLLFVPVGVWVVAAFSADRIGVVVGVLILLTVALSLTRLHLHARPTNAFAAGAVAGVSGTAASIDGPFLALVLQHEPPTRVRATLSAFFLVGSSMALAGLAVGGQVHASALRAGLVWVPFALVGYAAAQPARRHLDGARMRVAVLAFCGVAGAAVIVHALSA